MTYYKRFGSVMRAYELAGFQPPPATVKLIHTQRQIRLLRNDLYIRLKQLFSDRVRFISLPGQQFRQVVEIDGRLRVAVYLCRAATTQAPENPAGSCVCVLWRETCPALICTVDQSFSKLLNFYVFSPFGDSFRNTKCFARINHGCLPDGSSGSWMTFATL